MNFREMKLDGTEWKDLAQNRHHLWAVLSSIMKIRVLKNNGNS